MDFFGKHRRPKLEEGKMDDVSKVETAGYIPADVQIEMFIQAGRRLDQARKEQFDFGPEEEDGPMFKGIQKQFKNVPTLDANILKRSILS